MPPTTLHGQWPPLVNTRRLHRATGVSYRLIKMSNDRYITLFRDA